MVKTIIKKEFLDNLISFKFIACVLVAVVVTFICTAILSQDYKERLKNYDVGMALARENLANVPTYSFLQVEVYKRPSPLSIFVSGIDRKAGSHVTITHKDIPASLKGETVKNEFAEIVSQFDFSSVIIIVFTILAILLSYHAVSGEKEDGMLSLILSYSVPRYKLLIGKYLGGLISLAIPLAACFILGILIVIFSKSVAMNGEFLFTVGSLYILALLYLSCILLIGILVSTRTQTSFRSLIFLLGFYVIFTLLIPLGVQSYADRKITREATSLENNVYSIIDEKMKKLETESREFVLNPPSWVLFDYNYQGFVLSRINPKRLLDNYAKIFSFQEGLSVEYARKIYEFKRTDLQTEARTRNIQNQILAFVPSSSFERTAELIGDTGEDSLNRYLQGIARYWDQYVRYLTDKNAFGLKYFFPGPEELTPYEEAMVRKINEDRAGLISVGRHVDYRGKYLEEAMNYKPKVEFLNLGDMTRFTNPKITLVDKTKAALFNFSIMLFYNLFLFVLAHFSFNSYDPRRGE
jgi:ABC-type transport system involved in multi-copper enzyme maturation permease subunit